MPVGDHTGARPPQNETMKTTLWWRLVLAVDDDCFNAISSVDMPAADARSVAVGPPEQVSDAPSAVASPAAFSMATSGHPRRRLLLAIREE